MTCPICENEASWCDCDPKAVELYDELEECQDKLGAIKEQMKNPSIEEIGNACLSFRHDYGLMSEEDRLSLQLEAVNWLNAWRKALDV